MEKNKITPEEWMETPSKSYAIEDLRKEYRELFYTPEAIKMIEEFKFDKESPSE